MLSMLTDTVEPLYNGHIFIIAEVTCCHREVAIAGRDSNQHVNVPFLLGLAIVKNVCAEFMSRC